jgi:hypothetical protein
MSAERPWRREIVTSDRSRAPCVLRDEHRDGAARIGKEIRRIEARSEHDPRDADMAETEQVGEMEPLADLDRAGHGQRGAGRAAHAERRCRPEREIDQRHGETVAEIRPDDRIIDEGGDGDLDQEDEDRGAGVDCSGGDVTAPAGEDGPISQRAVES